jgi:hypothetical protein
MADNTVLGVETLADNLRIDRCRCSDTSTGPIHGIRLIDILTEATAVECEIEAPPAKRQHEGAHKPWGKRPVRLLGSVLVLMVMVIVIHGLSSYFAAPAFFTGASGSG